MYTSLWQSQYTVFVKRWSKSNADENLYIGMNFSTSLQISLYSDKTNYQKGFSYDFDGSSDKFGDKELKSYITFIQMRRVRDSIKCNGSSQPRHEPTKLPYWMEGNVDWI